MSNVLKNLGGGSAPVAATSTDLYTVPASTSTVVASIVACNQSATPTTIRISHAVAGAALATKQYLVYDMPIGANETIVLPIGITMAATDKIRVYATLATVSFNAYGQENS